MLVMIARLFISQLATRLTGPHFDYGLITGISGLSTARLGNRIGMPLVDNNYTEYDFRHRR